MFVSKENREKIKKEYEKKKRDKKMHSSSFKTDPDSIRGMGKIKKDKHTNPQRPQGGWKD